MTIGFAYTTRVFPKATPCLFIGGPLNSGLTSTKSGGVKAMGLNGLGHSSTFPPILPEQRHIIERGTSRGGPLARRMGGKVETRYFGI
jgi:hypothetical protein